MPAVIRERLRIIAEKVYSRSAILIIPADGGLPKTSVTASGMGRKKKPHQAKMLITRNSESARIPRVEKRFNRFISFCISCLSTSVLLRAIVIAVDSRVACMSQLQAPTELDILN